MNRNFNIFSVCAGNGWTERYHPKNTRKENLNRLGRCYSPGQKKKNQSAPAQNNQKKTQAKNTAPGKDGNSSEESIGGRPLAPRSRGKNTESRDLGGVRPKKEGVHQRRSEDNTGGAAGPSVFLLCRDCSPGEHVCLLKSGATCRSGARRGGGPPKTARPPPPRETNSWERCKLKGRRRVRAKKKKDKQVRKCAAVTLFCQKVGKNFFQRKNKKATGKLGTPH